MVLFKSVDQNNNNQTIWNNALSAAHTFTSTIYNKTTDVATAIFSKIHQMAGTTITFVRDRREEFAITLTIVAATALGALTAVMSQETPTRSDVGIAAFVTTAIIGVALERFLPKINLDTMIITTLNGMVTTAWIRPITSLQTTAVIVGTGVTTTLAVEMLWRFSQLVMQNRNLLPPAAA